MVSERLRAAARAAHRPEFFFVNIGANDGVSNDPIYPFLTELGWRGIVVEPVPHLFAALQANYRDLTGVVFEQAAIAATPRPLHYLAAGVGAELPWTQQVASLNRTELLHTIAQMRAHQYLGPVPDDLEEHLISVPVPCLTVAELLRKHDVRRVDFLNVDAEGADYEILAAFDLDRYRPAIVCIETSQMSAAEKQTVQSRLRAAGYAFLEIFDLFSEVYVQGEILPPPHAGPE